MSPALTTSLALVVLCSLGRSAILAERPTLEQVQAHLGGRDPKKVIVVPGRVVNIVGG